MALQIVFILIYAVTVSHALEFYYHDFNDTATFLSDISSKYPDLTTLYSIGKSVAGKDLWVLEVSAVNISKEELAPNVKIIGNIHGNEPVGKEMILHLIEYLLTEYGTNKEVTALLNKTRIHLLPLMNPDGYDNSVEGTCSTGGGRDNQNSVDLNRNFPDLHKTSPPRSEMQPETASVIGWMKEYNFILSASLHGGALVANYPFENRKVEGGVNIESKTPDDDVFKHLARIYANTHTIMHKGVECDGVKSFPGGITNGAAWYPVEGCMQDYNYLAHGCMEITLELSCCKYPIDEDLPRFWKYNKMALLKYIGEVHQGVRGIIKDEQGKPIVNATLRIIDANEQVRNAPFNTDRDGRFWRILLPGTYTLEILAPGYPVIKNIFKIQRNGHIPISTTLNIRISNDTAGIEISTETKDYTKTDVIDFGENKNNKENNEVLKKRNSAGIGETKEWDYLKNDKRNLSNNAVESEDEFYTIGELRSSAVNIRIMSFIYLFVYYYILF